MNNKQYKLINRITNEETICTKVCIEGFDYYVSNILCKHKEWFYVSFTDTIEQYDETTDYGEFHPHKIEWETIITTNNPSIDIPQIVDEDIIIDYSENIAKELYNPEAHRNESIKSLLTVACQSGYYKHAETHTLSDDEVVEFLEWSKEFYDSNLEKFIFDNTPDAVKTSEEMLQLFKEQQIKTIYYE